MLIGAKFFHLLPPAIKVVNFPSDGQTGVFVVGSFDLGV
jgi:hypothetical protein